MVEDEARTWSWGRILHRIIQGRKTSRKSVEQEVQEAKLSSGLYQTIKGQGYL